MKKPILMSFYLFILLTVMATTTFATSWIMLSAEEVNQKADVILLGKYDFKGKQVEGKHIFVGQEFVVGKVFKGSAAETTIVGIDPFDIGWASEFQAEGGEFLLFLEERGENDFHTPVGGPNGMVQVKDGQVSNQSTEENKTFYENIMKSRSEEPVLEAVTLQDTEKKTGITKLTLTFVGVSLLLFVGVWLRLRKR